MIIVIYIFIEIKHYTNSLKKLLSKLFPFMRIKAESCILPLNAVLFWLKLNQKLIIIGGKKVF